MASFVEARDACAGGHAWRFSQYGKLLAKKMGLAKDTMFIVRLGGLVHNLGKVGVSDTVLNKKGTITDDEFARS